MGAWQYDDSDLEKLSLIMTLHDVGFTTQEVEAYMRLFLDENGTGNSRWRCCTDSGTMCWTKSISEKNSWSGWIISVMKSAEK